MAGENSILNLEPDAFMGALDEMGIQGDQRDFLMREYQNKNSAFSGVFDYLNRANQAVADRGNRRAEYFPVEVPQDMSVFDAIKEGSWDWAMPGSLVGAATGSARAASAPGLSLQGIPYTEDQMTENAFNMAGMAQLGGAAAPVPRGAIRSNAPSWFGKKIYEMTPEEHTAWFAAPQDVVDAHVSAKNMATEQGIPIEDAVAHHWAKVGQKTDVAEMGVPSWWGKTPGQMEPYEWDEYLKLPPEQFDAIEAEYPYSVASQKYAEENPPPAAGESYMADDDQNDESWVDLESISPDEELDSDFTQFSLYGGPKKLSAPPEQIMIGVPTSPSKPSWHGKTPFEMTDEEFDAFSTVGQPVDKSGVADATGIDGYSPVVEEPFSFADDAEYDNLVSILRGSDGVPEPTTTGERQSLKVAEMLRDGRGSEVSNELYDSADLAYLRRLYDAGMTGRNLPMDFNSRMERAADMRFNTGNPLYRGRGSDRAHGEGNKTFTSDNPAVAGGYAGIPSDEKPFYGSVVKLLARGGSEMPEVVPPLGTGWTGFQDYHPVLMPDGTEIPLSEFISRGGGLSGYSYATDDIGRIARNLGYPGVRFRGIVDPGGSYYDKFGGPGKFNDPSNVRIDNKNSANLRVPTAFFDPRLSHLSNYNAANASPLTGAAALVAQEDDARNQLMRYLNEREDRR